MAMLPLHTHRSLPPTALLVFGLAACGGKAIIDPEGQGGAGATSGTVGTLTGPTAVVSTTTTGAPMNRCEQICSFIYGCGAMGLCPGFSGLMGDEEDFLFGSGANGCVDTCEGPTGMLLQGLVDQGNCEVTIENLNGASPDFAEVCQSGL